jgi:hypothetical protein
MKRSILSLLLIISLTSCSTLLNILPSAWDSNQAKVITDIRQKTIQINCKKDVAILKANLNSLHNKVEWLNLYSESKRTNDVLQMTNIYNETLNDMIKRIETKGISNSYCENKKSILVEQSSMISKGIQSRN